MRNYRHIEVRPIAGALGAEILGVDMARDLEDDVVAETRQAFLDNLVIFLRGQKATPQQQLAFAKRFGEPIEYPMLQGLPECPMITPVTPSAARAASARTCATDPTPPEAITGTAAVRATARVPSTSGPSSVPSRPMSV